MLVRPPFSVEWDDLFRNDSLGLKEDDLVAVAGVENDGVEAHLVQLSPVHAVVPAARSKPLLITEIDLRLYHASTVRSSRNGLRSRCPRIGCEIYGLSTPAA